MQKLWEELTAAQKAQVDRRYAITQFRQDRYLYRLTATGTVLNRRPLSARGSSREAEHAPGAEPDRAQEKRTDEPEDGTAAEDAAP